MNKTEQMLEQIATALERIANIVEQAYQDEHPEMPRRKGRRWN